MNNLRSSVGMLLCVLSLQVLATETIPVNQQTTLGLYLKPAEAMALKQQLGAGLLFVDVRTRAEIAWVGAPTAMDANIPFVRGNYGEWDAKRSFFKMEPNEDFVKTVDTLASQRQLRRDSPIVVMCRSGPRGALAANALAAAGYTRVYNLLDGFEGETADSGPESSHRVLNGWKNSGLPWTTVVDHKKLF